jgi:hypothetical protein
MDLKGIISIPGKPGLYKVISQVKSATIVESLIDGTKFPVYMSDKAAEIEGIAMFTTAEEIPVSNIMDAIYKKESGGPCIDPKSEDKFIKVYFEEILPNYDKYRVYVSQMRKLFTWYNFLQSKSLLRMKEDAEEKPMEEKEEVKEPEDNMTEDSK